MSLTAKRAWLLAIFCKCPFGAAAESCPAEAMRGMAMEERMRIADMMGPEQIENMLSHHKVCLLVREATDKSLWHSFGSSRMKYLCTASLNGKGPTAGRDEGRGL